MMNSRARIVAFAACFVSLSACSSALPPLRDDQTATISGQGIYYLQPSDYVASMMSRAAEMTVDHGYRYFTILNTGGASAYGSQSAIQPGRDVTIKLYSADEIAPGTRGVWDAQKILESGPPRVVAQSSVVPSVAPPPVYSPTTVYSPPHPYVPPASSPPPKSVPTATAPPPPPPPTPGWLHPNCTDSVCTW